MKNSLSKLILSKLASQQLLKSLQYIRICLVIAVISSIALEGCFFVLYLNLDSGELYRREFVGALLSGVAIIVSLAALFLVILQWIAYCRAVQKMPEIIPDQWQGIAISVLCHLYHGEQNEILKDTNLRAEDMVHEILYRTKVGYDYVDWCIQHLYEEGKITLEKRDQLIQMRPTNTSPR